jgi:CRP-like cAMP-binding protein
MSRSLETLARLPMFAGLDKPEIAVLDAQCLWRRAGAGAWVLDYGESGTDVFFVARGALRVTVLSSEREVILRDLAEGDFFGELAAIDGQPRSAGILAITEAVIGRMSGPRFLEAVYRHPSLCKAVLTQLAAEVRKRANQVNEFSTLSVNRRLHAELLRLAKPKPNDSSQLIISPPPTHAELAARVATRREAVNRELKALERAGLVERRRGALALPDPERFRRMLMEKEV